MKDKQQNVQQFVLLRQLLRLFLLQLFHGFMVKCFISIGFSGALNPSMLHLDDIVAVVVIVSTARATFASSPPEETAILY